jgi:energy-coupling factor transporter ATP-binding protein EcfA2
MLTEVILENFKCFGRHAIPFRANTIIVGRNNAGKSTIIEAMRLVALVLNRLPGLHAQEVPKWLDIAKINTGFSPSLEHQSFDFGNLFHRYADPPAKVTARFDSGIEVVIYVGGTDRVHAVLREAKHRRVLSKAKAQAIGIPKVGILPPIGPLSSSERILNPDYVSKLLFSDLASIHFRNQLNLLYDSWFLDFKRISEETWHGLKVQELRGQGKNPGANLELMVRNEDFVGEVAWMGHGLQMWLQTMWFLARCRDFDTVILDEPDVYMHADLQRKLIRFLRSRYPQVVVATHSVEIISEVEPENILVVDRERQQAQFTTDVPAVQSIVDQIGGIQNLQLARLWGSHKCLFVEGKDISLLKHFQNKLHPNSPDPVSAIPSLSVGGWSGWPYVVGSSMLLSGQVGRNIKSYCIFDSDFHTSQSISSRQQEAKSKRINLHIWNRKELENYLLIPSVIQRIISKRMKLTHAPPAKEAVADRIFSIAGEFEADVMDALSHEAYIENKKDGIGSANKCARLRMYPAWNSPEGRTKLACGKDVLSKISEWAQLNFKVSISATSVLNEMRLSEIPSEVVEVLTAIEEGNDFK